MKHTLVLASANQHKLGEFQTLLPSDLLALECAPQSLEVIENGESFTENALIKAKAYYDQVKRPTLADDSGLTVSALPDELGIYSARFGGEGLSYLEQNHLLLEKLKGVAERDAYFTSILCFYFSPKEIFFFEGQLRGTIAETLTGEGGFGYDPLFIPEGQQKSLAEMPDWKEKNSHRAKAVQQACRFFQERNCQS